MRVLVLRTLTVLMHEREWMNEENRPLERKRRESGFSPVGFFPRPPDVRRISRRSWRGDSQEECVLLGDPSRDCLFPRMLASFKLDRENTASLPNHTHTLHGDQHKNNQRITQRPFKCRSIERTQRGMLGITTAQFLVIPNPCHRVRNKHAREGTIDLQ